MNVLLYKQIDPIYFIRWKNYNDTKCTKLEHICRNAAPMFVKAPFILNEVEYLFW